MSAVTPAAQPPASQQAVVEAALVLLERMGLSPADLTAPARGRADVRRVRPGGVGGGERRDPPGVRLVLEPDRRALGHPAAGRADPVRHPAADGLDQNPRRGPATHGAAAARRNTWWPRCAACTDARSRTS
jgi:hypothetical protein